MIVALLNQMRGAGRTTLAVQIAGELALQGQRVALLDADGHSGALEWAEARRRNSLPPLFQTIGVSSRELRGGLWGLQTTLDHLIIDTPSHSADALRSALLAADTVLLPTRPERPAMGRCAATMQLVAEAQAAELATTATLVFMRAPIGMSVEPGAEVTVCGLRLPVAVSMVRERMSFALSRSTGLLVHEIDLAGQAEGDVRRLVGEVFGVLPAVAGG